MPSGLRAALLALLAAAGAPALAADGWPARSVRVIVAFAPGGATDTLGRIVAQKLTDGLGQPFVVENRPGAGGLVGAQAAAAAAPDGYTLLVSGVGPLVVVPAMNPNTPYDALRDFTHIALLGGPPTVFVVGRDIPAKNLREFVALARSKPDPIRYGSPGVGSHAQLIFELFQRQAGIKLTHVPYRGAGQAMTDLIGGHLATAATSLSSSAEQIKTGVLRGIAVTAAQRLPEFPDLPTYAEQGYPDLVAYTWFSLQGPAKMPADMVNRINAEVIRALKQPDVRERLQRDGIDPEPLDPAAFAAFVKSEIGRWTPIIKAARIKAE